MHIRGVMELNTELRIFDHHNIDEMDFASDYNSQYAQKFLLPLMREGTSKYIKNVNSRLELAQQENTIWPMTINEKEYENSYVCSPFSHYISYGKYSLYTLKNPILKGVLAGILNSLGFLLKRGSINRVVHVNNWLLSTNLYTEMSDKKIKNLRDQLVKKYPQHAIVFRSVNTLDGGTLYQKLKGSGFFPLGSRQIYFLEAASGTFAKTRSFKRDWQAFERSGYQARRLTEIQRDKIPRLVELYNDLYLDKYSPINPQFTPEFMELAIREELMEGQYLEKDGSIDGVFAYFHRDGIMTSPIVGYDRRLPQELGLYRMLMALQLREAEERELKLNLSSGAPNFKRSRGAKANIEYSMVYTSHLSLSQKLVWSFLRNVINKIGLPILKKYKL